MEQRPMRLLAWTSFLLCTLAPRGFAQNWVPITPSASPSPRYGPAMTYDAARRQTVLFGGGLLTGTPSNPILTAYQDTWTWDGLNWTQVVGMTRPTPRMSTMVYDPIRGEAILFGGQTMQAGTQVFLGDTWRWNGGWTQLFPQNSPSPRFTPAMAFDPATGRIVLFGGQNFQGGKLIFLNDTWTWDGATANWTQQFPQTSPSHRTAMCAHDSARNQVVLFGGHYFATTFMDTWTWDGVNMNWRQLSPLTSPMGRTGSPMEYDETRGRIVLFGGTLGNNLRLGDTWEWDGATWAQVVAGPSPLPRNSAGMAFDSRRKRMVLFGGVDQPGSNLLCYGDTWEYYGPGVSQSYGTGCGPTAPVALAAQNAPTLGRNFTLQTSGASPQANAALLVLGFSNQSWNHAPGPGPLPYDLGPLGMPGCHVYQSHNVAMGFPLAGGAGRVQLAIPATIDLTGYNSFLQAYIVDPAAGNPMGLLTTNGLDFVIGW